MKRYSKIIKTNPYNYNLNNPCENYLYKMAISKEILDYFQRMINETSSDLMKKTKKLVKVR